MQKEIVTPDHLDADARHVSDKEDSKYEDHHLRQFLLRFPDTFGQLCLGVPHLELHLFPDGADLHTGTYITEIPSNMTLLKIIIFHTVLGDGMKRTLWKWDRGGSWLH